MSLIPLDDRRGTTNPTPREGETPSSGVGRLWGHLKTLCARVSNRLRPRAAASEDASVTVRALPEDTTQQVEAVGMAHEQLELVSTETETTLTVSAADNPDASVTSDTWTRVER